MSIAEKIITVAENVPKVYEAGKNDFGYKKTFTGESLDIEDIVPIRHAVSAELTSKNLFVEQKQNIQINPTKTYFLSSSEGAAKRMSFELYDIEGNEIKGDGVSINNFYYNGNVWYLGSDVTVLKHSLRITGENRDRVAYINFTDVKYPDFQFEQGTSATSYAPHITDFSNIKLIVNGSDVYSSDEKGVVEEMISAPTMSIISNTPGVIISAECFVDAAAYVKKLETAILKLGGTI